VKREIVLAAWAIDANPGSWVTTNQTSEQGSNCKNALILRYAIKILKAKLVSKEHK
jgi:hypothetical protein